MTKLCPIHPTEPRELPLSEFGTCRARKDGRNLYCKSCNRTKSVRQRLDAKAHLEWRSTPKIVVRKPNVRALEPRPSQGQGRLTLSDAARRVLELLTAKPLSQKQLSSELHGNVKLRSGQRLADWISDALAELRMDHRLIDFDVKADAETRVYSARKVRAA